MEPVFNNRSEFIRYSVFKQHLSCLSLFLDLKTVNHFSSLSIYFNNLINNPKSEFGWMFWKSWAVKNGGIKAFKGKNINYKFKLMKARLDFHLKNAKRNKLSSWSENVMCQNCNKMCCVERFRIHMFEDRYEQFCNCEITNCESKLEMFEKQIRWEKEAIIRRKKQLLHQLERLDVRMEKAKEKEKKLKSVTFVEKMKCAFENVKENDRYKSIRNQADKALKQIGIFRSYTLRERWNPNYRADQ